jgi:hypothetical protein
MWCHNPQDLDKKLSALADLSSLTIIQPQQEFIQEVHQGDTREENFDCYSKLLTSD